MFLTNQLQHRPSVTHYPIVLVTLLPILPAKIHSTRTHFQEYRYTRQQIPIQWTLPSPVLRPFQSVVLTKVWPMQHVNFVALLHHIIRHHCMSEVVVKDDLHIGEHWQLTHYLLKMLRHQWKRIGVRDDDDWGVKFTNLVQYQLTHHKGYEVRLKTFDAPTPTFKHIRVQVQRTDRHHQQPPVQLQHLPLTPLSHVKQSLQLPSFPFLQMPRHKLPA